MNKPRRSIPRRPVHGVLLLDKPLGLSSNDALQKVKRLLRAEKAGHTGTLDPLATGLLPLCFGAATKFSQVSLDADKRYTATLQLGVTTTTADAEGEVVETRPVCRADGVAITRDDVVAACAGFIGDIDQLPPMYSALKRDGKPLYEYARAGIEVDRQPRRVTIHAIGVSDSVPAAPGLTRGAATAPDGAASDAIDSAAASASAPSGAAASANPHHGAAASANSYHGAAASANPHHTAAVSAIPDHAAAASDIPADGAAATAAPQTQFTLDVRCTKGTYIRTLAEDIGRALGCGAHLIALRRTETGPLTLTEAWTLAQLQAMDEPAVTAALHPADHLLADWPLVRLDADNAGRFLSGLRRRMPELPDMANVRVFGPEQSAFLGSGHVSAGELISDRLLSPTEVQGLLDSARLPQQP